MKPEPGTLFLVPTPLGEDSLAAILPRPVIELVAGLDYFVAENAKSARAFLKAIHAEVPLRVALQSIQIAKLDGSTPEAELPALLEPLLAGRNAGLVSEAGAPAVADPGAVLVARAHQLGIPVKPLTGPSSILLALMASGLNGQRFSFQGYLPVEMAQRRLELQRLERESRQSRVTQIFIETPYRNQVMFDGCLASLSPDTRLCIAVRLTMPDESVASHTVAQWKKKPAPDLKGRPAIFLFLAP
jgi:16S rRNA (cytidine1402-2'-O)-methyltransferase